MAESKGKAVDTKKVASQEPESQKDSLATHVTLAPRDLSIGAIHGAICDMIREIDPVGKDHRNAQQGFLYRSVDDVYNALHTVMAKCRVYVLTSILDEQREDRPTRNGGTSIFVRLRVRYRIVSGIDGTYVDTEVIGEASDSGDKATNKALATAFKYAFFQLLCIPTEAIDPDATTVEIAASQAAGQSGPARPDSPPATARRPAAVSFPTPEALEKMSASCDVRQGQEIEKIANQMRKAGAIAPDIHHKVVSSVLARRASASSSVEELKAVSAAAKAYQKFGWMTDAEVASIEASVAEITVGMASNGTLAAE